ncbi:MAG: DHH family phosphoesterase [Planctomycetaceae bacterium]
MNIDWLPFQNLVSQHQSFVISSHVKPDADAIGSEIGLALLLEQQGKSARIINTSATPPNLLFLDPGGRVQQFGTGDTKAVVSAADVHVIVDTSSWTQLADVGQAMKNSSSRRVVIDHHASSDDLGALAFKDSTREATGSLIVDHQRNLSAGRFHPPPPCRCLPRSPPIPAGFRFAATTGQTMRIAGQLIDLGLLRPARTVSGTL